MPNLLNGIQCDNFEWRGKDSVEFSLTCTYDEAASIRAPLVVTDGGETVASFEGMEPMGVWQSGESFRLRASRELTEQAEGSIRALESNLTVLSTQVTAADAKADEAKSAANPQVVTFARMAVAPMAADMTVSEGASVSTLWPEKKVGDTVNLKEFFWFNGELYRCNQPELTITAGQEPDKDLPALYGHVTVAPDGVLVWDADDLTGAPDIYNTGVRVHYPDADGPVYVSKRDGNTSEPGTDEWWELAE